jgi:hypothetical protein
LAAEARGRSEKAGVGVGVGAGVIPIVFVFFSLTIGTSINSTGEAFSGVFDKQVDSCSTR